MTELIQNTITCPRCSSSLTTNVFTVPSGSSCGHCGLAITGRLFPRFFMPLEEHSTNTKLSSDNESSCFFHPNNLAVSHCSECGRFLCALCELNIEGRIICPTCLEKLDQEKRVKTFTNQVTFSDSIALTLSIIPMLILPITFVTAPFTLIYIWKHFKDPKAYIIPRRRWRFYLAGLIAGIQIAAWVILITIFLVE